MLVEIHLAGGNAAQAQWVCRAFGRQIAAELGFEPWVLRKLVAPLLAGQLRP